MNGEESCNWPGASPVPDKEMVCGLPTPVLVTVTVPLIDPATVGLKVTLN